MKLAHSSLWFSLFRPFVLIQYSSIGGQCRGHGGYRVANALTFCQDGARDFLKMDVQ